MSKLHKEKVSYSTIPRKALYDKNLSAEEKTILNILCDKIMFSTSQVTRITNDDLGKLIGRKYRVISSYIKHLEDRGYIITNKTTTSWNGQASTVRTIELTFTTVSVVTKDARNQ